MTDILPEPTDSMPEYSLDNKKSRNPKVKRTIMILVSLVIIAVLCLIAGFIYDVIHNHDQDNTRKQDLTYISEVLNGYYNLYHFYPTLNQINSSTFGALTPSLDRQKFKDPTSSSSLLLVQPATNGYAYEVSPSGCTNINENNCTSYKLTAILSNNDQYTVKSPTSP